MKLHREWNRLRKEKELLDEKTTLEWLSIPNQADITELKLLSAKTSFLGKRKFKKKWSRFSNEPSYQCKTMLQLREQHLFISDISYPVVFELAHASMLAMCRTFLEWSEYTSKIFELPYS